MLDRLDAATDRQRHETLGRNLRDDLDGRLGMVDRGLDVEQDKLINAAGVVNPADRDRTSQVTKDAKLDALDNIVTIEEHNRDHARLKHIPENSLAPPSHSFGSFLDETACRKYFCRQSSQPRACDNRRC